MIKTFCKLGFQYTNVESENNWNIYRQSRGKKTWFELVRLKKKKAGER